MKTYIVDSFTSKPFKGNPAGVCFPLKGVSDEIMLNIACEFGLSETAFIQETPNSDTYMIRYFSPKKEIPLCGHATLASAKVIFKNTGLDGIHFITSERVDLFIQRSGEDIIMEFPVYSTIPAAVSLATLNALGLPAVTDCVFSPKNKILLLEMDSDTGLANLQPDFNALLRSAHDINGVLVTAPSTNNSYDFQYRYFWPWSGTNEDPVTGGVQTFLAKYWSDKTGKTKLTAFQPSARSGTMQVELKNDRVFLTGQAVIILEGDLLAFD